MKRKEEILRMLEINEEMRKKLQAAAPDLVNMYCDGFKAALEWVLRDD